MPRYGAALTGVALRAAQAAQIATAVLVVAGCLYVGLDGFTADHGSPSLNVLTGEIYRVRVSPDAVVYVTLWAAVALYGALAAQMSALLVLLVGAPLAFVLHRRRAK
jgi:hypothetical protein